MYGPVLALAGLAVITTRFGDLSDATVTEMLPELRAATVVLALVLAATANLHGRATGLTSGFQLSAAALLVAGALALDLAAATVSTGFAQEATTATVLTSLRLALLLGAAATVGRCFLAPEVDSAVRPTRTFAVAGATMLGLAGTFVAILAVAPGWSRSAAAAGAAGLAAIVWGAVALVGFARAARSPSPMAWGIAWLSIAMTAAELTHGGGTDGAGVLMGVGSVLLLCGLSAALLGTIQSLSRAAVGRRDRLHDADRDHERHRQASRADEEVRTHEARNAILAIEGAARVLQRHPDSLPPEDRAFLTASVVQEVAHLRHLVEARGSHTETVRLDGLAAQRARLARGRGRSVEVIAEARVHAFVDGHAVTQILDNLLINAERHGSLGGPSVVEVEVRRQGDRVRLAVRDHGPGVPEEQRQRIFERGCRLDPCGEGDGIGLYQARRLARRLGGDVAVEATPGGGATFVLTLPAVDASEGIETSERAEASDHADRTGLPDVPGDRDDCVKVG